MYYGTQSATFLASKTCELIPSDIKGKGSLSDFKKTIKNEKPNKCPCSLCTTFIQNIDFL